MISTSIGASSEFGIEDVHAVVRGHDPARTRVVAEGDWLRVDLGRPARDGNAGGIAQTIYLYRLGPPTQEGARPGRSASELRDEIARLVIGEFRRADAPSDKPAGRSGLLVGGDRPRGGSEVRSDAERPKPRRAAATARAVEQSGDGRWA